MKKLLIILFCVAFTACGDDDDVCVRGSGSLSTYDNITLPDFDKISVSGPISINYIQGSTQSVVIRAEPELFAILEYEVTGNTLEVGFPRNAICIDTNIGVYVDVTVPNLTRIALSGEGQIQTVNDIDQDEMVIDISGEAEVQMSGTVNDMQIICSGALVAQNFELFTNIQRLDIAGAATVDLYCEIELSINVSGAADVNYKGNPQISQNVSGTLNLVNAN